MSDCIRYGKHNDFNISQDFICYNQSRIPQNKRKELKHGTNFITFEGRRTIVTLLVKIKIKNERVNINRLII